MTTVEHGTAAADVRWPPEAPDARLGGLLLLDSSVMPAGAVHSDEDQSDASDDDKPQRDWNIYLVRLASDPGGREFGLVGELFVCEDDWHLKVSALTPLQLRGALREESHALSPNELSARYGPWATHVLWDFVAQHARMLAAGVLQRFDLPSESPEAEYELPQYLRAPEK